MAFVVGDGAFKHQTVKICSLIQGELVILLLKFKKFHLHLTKMTFVSQDFQVAESYFFGPSDFDGEIFDYPPMEIHLFH